MYAVHRLPEKIIIFGLRARPEHLKMKKPTLLSKAACWPSIWPASCLGIIANVSEKINTGFENHKQPHSTTGNLIKKNWKRCDALLLGARPSPRLPLICGNHEYFAYFHGFFSLSASFTHRTKSLNVLIYSVDVVSVSVP